MEQRASRTEQITVGAVWAIALAGSVTLLAGALAGDAWATDASAFGRYGALSVVFAVAVLATLVAQLLIRKPEGFVTRAGASVGGAAVIVGLAALLLLPLS
jgi:hypothetical protein